MRALYRGQTPRGGRALSSANMSSILSQGAIENPERLTRPCLPHVLETFGAKHFLMIHISAAG